MRKTDVMTPEQIEERKRARAAAYEARIERERIERDSKKRKIYVDTALFVKICRFGYITDSTDLGMFEIRFNKFDILNFCNGIMVEKEYYGKVYNFLLCEMTRYEKIDVVKNSALFWELVDQL